MQNILIFSSYHSWHFLLLFRGTEALGVEICLWWIAFKCFIFIARDLHKWFSSRFFYIHGSLYRTSLLIRSNKMQQYAGTCSYLLQNHSTCFGCPSHPSSGVHKTVTVASGTGHSVWSTTFLQHGQIRPRRRKVVAQILWPVPEAAVTVLCAPDGGCDGHPKHVEWFCSK